MRRSLLNSVIAAAAGVFLAPCAPADIVVLLTGKTLRGEVIAEDREHITFRWSENGIWATTRIHRGDIEMFLAEEGDQSDAGMTRAEDAEEAEAGEEITTPGGSNKDREGEEAEVRRPPADTTVVAWLPLHGQVGGLVDDSVAGTFDAAMVEKCLEEAHRQGASIVVLDLHSPGGLVDEMEAICDTIIDWHDRLRIVAWPDEAFSAAAIITMCCKEVVVRENSLIGAATIIQRQGSRTTALDAKMASPHYARQRQYMERSGHPYEVVAAMTIQETRLWWSPTQGFTTTAPQPPAGRGNAAAGDWTEVDDQRSILTMTASDSLKWGIADGQAPSQDALLAHLAIATPKTEVLDLTDVMNEHQAALDRSIGNVQEQFEIYLRGLASINQSMISLLAAQRQRDRDRVDSLRKDVVRGIGRVRAAGRMIHRIQQRSLEGGIQVPREFLDQIEYDGEALAELARAAGDENWGYAGQLLGEVLTAWRKLTGNEP